MPYSAMNDLKFDPCMHCSGDRVTVEEVSERVYAAICRACAARGPIRYQADYQDVDLVKALAADDWNERVDGVNVQVIVQQQDIDAAQQIGGDGLDCEPPGKPSADQSHEADSSGAKTAVPPGGGNGTAHKARKAKGKAPKEVSHRQMDIGDRVSVYLGRLKLSAQGASDSGVDLGVHVATIYNVLKGKKVSQQTLDKIAIALDKLESKPLPEAQVIPNKLAPITGMNPLPKHAAPPRCAPTL